MKDVRDALMVGRNTEGKLVRRPLSPHLQVYKPQLSSGTSIFHRATGIILAIGATLFTLWLVCAASGDGPYSIMRAFWGSWIGLAILFFFTLSLFYHFCNGIRHLAWDMGRGFDLPDMHRSGHIVIAASILITIAFWAIAFAVR